MEMKPWFYIFYNESLSYTKALKVMKNEHAMKRVSIIEEYNQQKKSKPSKLVTIFLKVIFNFITFPRLLI